MRYYQLHHRHLRFIEFVRLARPFGITAALMWLPVKMGLLPWKPQLVPRHESVADAIVPIEELPQPSRSHIAGVITELGDSDYIEPLIELQNSSDPGGQQIVGVALRARHRSGQQIIQCLFAVAEEGHQHSQTQFVTFLSGGRTVGTTNGRPTIDRIPGASATYHPGLKFEQLETIHLQKLSNMPDCPIPIHSNADMIRELDSLSDRYFQHMVARGVMTEGTA